jgi:N-acetyl-alpha-D-muramate 1-phosphate uridylyltransferase
MSFDPRFRPDVMLLAAGLGTRLRPLTDRTPKPLIDVAGNKLIDRVIAEATDEGFTRFAVNAHHLAAEVRAHVEALAAASPQLRFRLSEEVVLLDTGGGVKHALPLLDGTPILVMNTDAFWPRHADAPLVRLLDRHASGGADIVLLCAQPRRALGFRRSHDFCLDPRGRITADSGQPVIYAGVALVGRALVEAVPEPTFSLYRIFEAAIEAGTAAGVVLDAPWLHVGDHDALREAEALLGATAA